MDTEKLKELMPYSSYIKQVEDLSIPFVLDAFLPEFITGHHDHSIFVLGGAVYSISKLKEQTSISFSTASLDLSMNGSYELVGEKNKHFLGNASFILDLGEFHPGDFKASSKYVGAEIGLSDMLNISFASPFSKLELTLFPDTKIYGIHR